MERILEPEIMDGEEQTKVYATADFAEENQGFVDQFLALYPDLQEGTVLGFGLWPRRTFRSGFSAVIRGCASLRWMRPVPCCIWAEEAVRQAGLEDRITLICSRFQDVQLDSPADAVISNSLGASRAQCLSVLVCPENLSQARGTRAHHGTCYDPRPPKKLRR